jgi:hypothetical protein
MAERISFVKMNTIPKCYAVKWNFSVAFLTIAKMRC